MEWNHFLPKCVFGDQPIGHYLLLKHHAIASALQTLAMNRNCLCGWHKKYLPLSLWNLCSPFYKKQARQLGADTGAKTVELQIGCHTEENRFKGGTITYLRKIGCHDPKNEERKKRRLIETKGKKVSVHCLEGEIKIFQSISEAARFHGVSEAMVRKYIRYSRTLGKGQNKGLLFMLCEQS
jgi:hypothetical protein